MSSNSDQIFGMLLLTLLWSVYHDPLCNFGSGISEQSVKNVVSQFLHHWHEESFDPTYSRAWTHQRLTKALLKLDERLKAELNAQMPPPVYVPQYDCMKSGEETQASVLKTRLGF